jgi:hypothetical protein
MHMRYTMRWGAVLSLVGAGLLALAGCGEDKLVATTQLSGANENPPVTATSATGTATATLDGDELTVNGTFSNLSSDLQEVSGSAAHVHQAPVGQNGPIVFNLTVTVGADNRTGSYTGTKTLSPDEQDAFKAGEFYVNVHSVNYMGGEIRGQFSSPKKQ